jgi:hypothetical protein
VQIVCHQQQIRRRREIRRNLGHDVGPREAHDLEARSGEHDPRLVARQLPAMDEQQAIGQIDIGAQDATIVVSGNRR